MVIISVVRHVVHLQVSAQLFERHRCTAWRFPQGAVGGVYGSAVLYQQIIQQSGDFVQQRILRRGKTQQKILPVRGVGRLLPCQEILVIFKSRCLQCIAQHADRTRILSHTHRRIGIQHIHGDTPPRRLYQAHMFAPQFARMLEAA